MPAGGYCYEDWIRNKIGEYACYWTANVKTKEPMLVYTLDYTGSANKGVVGNRYSGRLIRAVYNPGTDTGITANSVDKQDTPIEIYNLNGLCVFSGIGSYSLPSGIYIIKKDGESKKLIVR